MRKAAQSTKDQIRILVQNELKQYKLNIDANAMGESTVVQIKKKDFRVEEVFADTTGRVFLVGYGPKDDVAKTVSLEQLDDNQLLLGELLWTIQSAISNEKDAFYSRQHGVEIVIALPDGSKKSIQGFLLNNIDGQIQGLVPDECKTYVVRGVMGDNDEMIPIAIEPLPAGKNVYGMLITKEDLHLGNLPGKYHSLKIKSFNFDGLRKIMTKEGPMIVDGDELYLEGNTEPEYILPSDQMTVEEIKDWLTAY